MQKHQGLVLESESNEVGVETEKSCDEVEVEESTMKPWNLRPRKSVRLQLRSDGL